MTLKNLFDEIRDLTDTDVSSYSTAVITRRLNTAYEDVVSRLLSCDGTFQFDDSNFTDHPIGTTTMVAAQHDYTFADSHLKIERVEVKDNDGIWHLIKPIDKADVGEALDEFYKTDGLPVCYDKNGNSIWLYPAPSSTETTLTSGLKVYFQRTADVFTDSDVTTGTATPGFASPFHILLAYKAALPYCISYKKDRVPAVMTEIRRLEDDMVAFYSKREKDTRDILTTRGISFR